MDDFLSLALDVDNGYLLYKEYMKDWVEIDEYSVLFESDTDPVVKAQLKNEETAGKSSNVIVNLIHKVITMIDNLIKSIVSFFQELGLNGDEKEAFQNFREQIKKNPKLKNVKVTVKDFREINKKYDDILKRSEQELRKAKADSTYDLGKIIKELQGVIGEKFEAPSMMIASELALKFAESNQDNARAIKIALNTDKAFMQQIEKTLGKREAKKFKNRIDNAADMTLLTKCRITLLGRRYKTAESAISSTINNLCKGGFLNPLTRLGRLAWKNKVTREMIGDGASVAGTAIKGAIAVKTGKLKGKALARADSLLPGDKTWSNKLERQVNKEKKTYKGAKSFWGVSESTLIDIDEDLRNEILEMSEDIED